MGASSGCAPHQPRALPAPSASEGTNNPSLALGAGSARGWWGAHPEDAPMAEAEATDRPAPAAGEGAAPPAPPPPAEAGTYTGLDALPTGDAEPYRPVSLLAVAAFVAAVAHAGLVLLLAAAAFLNRAPLLLPLPFILWPLGGLALCWMARVQIQTS